MENVLHVVILMPYLSSLFDEEKQGEGYATSIDKKLCDLRNV